MACGNRRSTSRGRSLSDGKRDAVFEIEIVQSEEQQCGGELVLLTVEGAPSLQLDGSRCRSMKRICSGGKGGVYGSPQFYICESLALACRASCNINIVTLECSL